MIMRLVTGSFFLLIAAWLAPGLRAQNPAPPIASPPATDQQSRPEPQPSADERKRSVSPKTPDRSSTVGNPDAPVPLKVKGKLRYFAIESFRPGIYPVAAFYDGLTMANPPKAYPAGMAAGLCRLCPQLWRLHGELGRGAGRKIRCCIHQSTKILATTRRAARTFLRAA